MSTHSHDLSAFAHAHRFGSDAGRRQRERALALVAAITLATMIAELITGYWSGSLALTADGWHMGTHALALGGAVLAYRLSARASSHDAYAFGGWKIEVLSAYTSGLLLAAVALWLVIDSIATLRAPHPIAYREALAVAAIGLAVNAASAWLLARGARGDRHAHEHPHDAGPEHGAHHHDHNFGAAYVHVLADAFTSLLAIGALAGGLWLGWRWLDPAVALVGAAVIARWAFSVLRHSARALVDATSDRALTEQIRERIESDGDAKLADLHVWQVGARAWTVVVSIVADRPLDAMAYRRRLEAIDTLEHVTVEVHRCRGPAH
jgi:cation diffusion facilitator family transporter